MKRNRIIRVFLIIGACSLLIPASCAVRKTPFEEGGVSRVITHMVAAGETWRSIARDYYGRPGRADDLAAYNGFEENDKPRPGTGIKIPLSRGDLESIRESEKAVSVYNGGLEDLAEGNFAEAVARFREAIKLDRNLYDAYFNLGVTYQRMSLHDKAVTVLKDLIVRSGSNPEYHYGLGNSYFYTGRYEKAEEAFQKALELQPDHAKSVFSLGILYEKTGETEQAVRTWKRYLRLDSDSAWADRARTHLKSAGEPDGSGR